MNTVLLLKLRAQLELAITKREGLIAQNKIDNGEPITNGDKNFYNIQSDINEVIHETQQLLNMGINE